MGADRKGTPNRNGKKQHRSTWTSRRNSFLVEAANRLSLHGLTSRRTEKRAGHNITRPLEGTHPDYPFENIVFQGGGAKGVVYAGAIQALEELGIRPFLKRFAGTSIGCCYAVYL